MRARAGGASSIESDAVDALRVLGSRVGPFDDLSVGPVDSRRRASLLKEGGPSACHITPSRGPGSWPARRHRKRRTAMTRCQSRVLSRTTCTRPPPLPWRSRRCAGDRLLSVCRLLLLALLPLLWGPGAGVGAPAAAPASGYRIAAGDAVFIAVWGQERFTQTCPVNASGTIAYPLLGDVPAAGLTCAELQDRLSGALHKYLKRPQVLVSHTEAEPLQYWNGTALSSADE